MLRAEASGKSLEQTVEQLRSRIRAVETSSTRAGGAMSAAATSARSVQTDVRQSVVGAPSWLARVLVHGGMPRAAATSISDCPSALVHILAAVTARGGCAAIVQYPALALAAIQAAGGDLERLVIIPDAQPHVAAVLGTLVEGLDMVVYRPDTGGSQIAPTFARPVEARLRKSNCALLAVGSEWPQSRLHINLEITGVFGLGQGSGRIRGLEIQGNVWGKAQPPVRIQGSLGATWQHRGWDEDPYETTLLPVATQPGLSVTQPDAQALRAVL